MGNVHILAAAASRGGGSLYLFIIIAAIFGLMYFVMIRPQRRRQQQMQQMQGQVGPGQRVRTTAGMYATVVALEDADVVLEVAPGVHVRFLRRAIMDVIQPDTGPGLDGQSADQTEPEDSAESGAAAE